MDHSTVDQYFELALDLPERERERMLTRLADDEPAVAAEVRRLLANPTARRDFACSSTSMRKPDTVHHVAVQVDDVARAVQWYRSVLSCEVEYEDATWAMLEFGNVRLALVTPERHPPHLCVVRRDARKFGELTPHRDGTRSIYIVDPWGNSIEVMDEGSLSSSRS